MKVFEILSICEPSLHLGSSPAVNGISQRIGIYRGRLTDPTREHTEYQFHTGELRVLVATFAYAIGVNPPSVKWAIQRGSCSLDTALQKLGRENRGGLNTGEKGFFCWLPNLIVRGPLHKDIPIEQRHLWGLGRRRKNALPGELASISMSEWRDSGHDSNILYVQEEESL